MASAFPPGGTAASSSDSDFAFAFNDSKFSDRILRIEIIPDFPETQSNGQECTSLADWARERKRRRLDIKRDNVFDYIAHREERILSSQMPETEKGVGANQDEEAVAMVKGSPSDAGVKPDQLEISVGDRAARSDNSTVIEVKTLHINSAILAAKSPFFYKLFSNGMIESEQRHVTLPIHASEAAALMDLLNFMYSNTLMARTRPALLDVLRAADKFAVTSCMRYCSRLLRDLPMTRESALEYLDLHSSLLMAYAVQPLTAAAKQFLVGLYKDIAKFHDDIPNLHLAGLEAVLSNDDLQVASEDVVYDIVLKWARTHYPKLEERREIFGSRLSCLIRFPYMTGQKLMNCLACDDFDREHVTKLVLEALLFKTQASRRPQTLDAETENSSHHRYVERAYKFRPTKVVEFELPRKECILYLDLKRDEGARLFPAGRVFSQPFHLGSQLFILSAHCKMDQRSSLPHFGLLLFMLEMGSVSLSVEYSVRSKSTKDYMVIFKGTCTFTGGRHALQQNSFSVPWTTFMAEENPYFVNDILHLRAVLTVGQ